MSTAIPRTTPSSLPKFMQTPFLRFWGTSVGLKLIMATTGVGLSGFVLVHMLGNLQIFQGAEALDAYGHLLHMEPAVLWGARVALLTMVGLHIWSFLVLTGKIWNAQPKVVGAPPQAQQLDLGVAVDADQRAAPAGVHRLPHPPPDHRHRAPGLPRRLGLRQPRRRLEGSRGRAVYVASMALLGLHLWHGTWSLFQTLGADQGRHKSLGRRFATVFTAVVVAGFTVVPLAVVSGVIKPVPAKQTDENGRQFDDEGKGHDVPSPAARERGEDAVTIETLRITRAARPFRPFEVHAGSGEAYMVTHPEVIALAPEGETAVVFPGPGRIGIIDVASITELATFPSSHKVGADDSPDITA